MTDPARPLPSSADGPSAQPAPASPLPTTVTASSSSTPAPASVSRADAWTNALTGEGTTSDKRTYARIRARGEIPQADLDTLFAEDDIVARICELPARDMLRAGITIPADDDGAVANKLAALDARRALYEAKVWSRLHGGALILLITRDGQMMDQPLVDDAPGNLESLHVLDRWDVHVDGYYSDPAHPRYGAPEFYRIVSSIGATGTAPLMAKIHESRFIRLDGTLTGRRRRRYLQGWSDSVVLRVIDVVRDFHSAHASSARLITDFAQATIQIKQLSALLASDHDDVVRKRLHMMNLARSVGNWIPLDEGEVFAREATPVAGLPDLIDRVAQRLSVATGIPVTLLMGEAPAGLNATGEGDARNWYDLVSSMQESELRPAYARLIRLAAKSIGAAPKVRDIRPGKTVPTDEWAFTFNPLWQRTDAEVADTRLKVAQADQIYVQLGVTDSAEIALSRFGSDGYSIETVLDDEARDEDAAPVGPDGAPLPGVEGAAPASTGKVQDQALNGAQIASMLEIIRAVSVGDIPKSAGIALAKAALVGLDASVEAMFRDVKEGSTKPEPPPMMPAPGMVRAPAPGAPAPARKVPDADEG